MCQFTHRAYFHSLDENNTKLDMLKKEVAYLKETVVQLSKILQNLILNWQK